MDNTNDMMDEDQNNNTLGGGCIKREKTAAELRKSNKPLMERKRRERINNCLQQLKSILMEVTKKESSYYSKLEKADILEMTVKYLKNMKRQQLSSAMTTDPSILGKYIAGYNECTTEISQYLNGIEGLNTDTRARLLNHLANSLQRNSISMATNSAVNNLQLSMNQSTTTSGGGATAAAAATQPVALQIPQATQPASLPGAGGGLCVFNQTSPAIQASPAIQTIPASAMQLVPAKLPSGDLVFLLANQQSVQQNSGVSVVSTIQNNVNNINISPNQAPVVSVNNIVATVPPQFAFPAMTPILVSPRAPESPASSLNPSTSGSSPESDISDSSCKSMMSLSSDDTSTPVTRRHQGVIRHALAAAAAAMCSGDSDSSSDSENNDDDVINNNEQFRDPMWRPW